jgi:TPR repeat protein
MMIARTHVRPEKAPTAIAEGIARSRTESTLGIPRKKKHTWARILLLVTVLVASAPYLYWLETNYALQSRTFKRYSNAMDQQDYTKAIGIVRPHAAKGNAEAQYDLAVMIENGFGTAADRQAAYKLYRQAAAKGQPDAIDKVKKIDAYEKEQSKRQ